MAWHTDLLNSSVARPETIDRALARFQRFMHSQVISSVVLLICAVIAILWANSPWSESYFHLWETEVGLSFGDFSFAMTLHGWVNEALMMAFFLVVGLEVKEQIIAGELSSPRRALLPVAAAAGGMIVPALIFSAINLGSVGAAGWGIPMSTDIAFALGILALLGPRIPLSLKIFLAALAIADDLGAIAVITLFYTESIAVNGLLVALGFWLAIFVLSRLGIFNALIYFALSCGVWFGFIMCGIHATIAGVLVAIAIPAHSLVDPKSKLDGLLDRLDSSRLAGRGALHDHEQQEALHELNGVVQDIEPPLVRLLHSLQPWVMFVVMPLFALSNAGVVIGGDIAGTLTSPVSLGVILGLVIGKPVGITLFTWLMVRSGLAELPSGHHTASYPGGRGCWPASASQWRSSSRNWPTRATQPWPTVGRWVFWRPRWWQVS
ncbi:Na+/H+ antiporter NhaA [bacterium]|nr:Na+/H+ antiporter NhaA [bacterium]